MDWPRDSAKMTVKTRTQGRWLNLPPAALGLLLLVAVPGFGARVPVRDGQTVKLKLRSILTTDNVRKGDDIEFDVAEDVMINGHIAIAKGATAHGRILDVKGAYNPRASNAEVIFQFTTVSSVDHQEIPLRPHVERTKKGHDEEIHEKSVIPGQIARVVGADKGKEYEVYVDGSFNVDAPDAIAAPPPVAEPTPAAASTPAPVAAPAAPAAPAALSADIGAAPSSVEFSSTPDAAEIVIDGNVVGNTPSTLRLTPGHHSIEIRMAGYRTWTRMMVVDPESHPSVRATLIKQ